MGRIEKIALILTIFALLFLLLYPAFAQNDRGIKIHSKRLALVIGNSAYKSSPLNNTVNDAEDMTTNLRKLGFKVMLEKNADQRRMDDAIRYFGKQLKDGGVGLFYFAGHGMQVNGRNYLIPINAKIETESDVKYEAVDASRVLGKMEDAGNQLNIVILDACRNNPLAKSFRSDQKGLARMDAPTGSLIAYSTAPGEVAADGTERNGIFTKHLIRHMRTPSLPIEQVLKRVRIDVASETNERQIPWESSSLMGDFYFNIDKTVKATETSNLGSTSEDSKKTLATLPKTKDELAPGSSRFKVALFPGRSRVKNNEMVFKGMVLVSMKDVASDNGPFVIKYSYYDLDPKLGAKKLPNQFITDKILRELWIRKSLFDPFQPNIELLSKLGRQLKVDLIATFQLAMRSSPFAAGVSFYLIDVNTKEKYSEKDTVRYFEAPGHLPYLVEKCFDTYAKQKLRN